MSHVWRAGMEAVFVGWPKDAVTPYIHDYFEEGKVYVVCAVVFVEGGFIYESAGSFYKPKIGVYLGFLHTGRYGATAEAFRPVQKRSTDIAVFHELRRGVERVVKEKA